MYFVMIPLLLFLFPALCAALQWSTAPSGMAIFVIAKWFVFWPVGVRLFLAGVKQISQPSYTAKVILGLKDDESHILVRELGFANLSLGTIGLLSLWKSDWTLPCLLAGGLFYGMAGINHLRTANRNAHQHMAMASDLIIAALLLILFFMLIRW